MNTYKILNTILFLFMLSISAFAQVKKTEDLAVTDTELLKYANATDSVNEMLADVRNDLTAMVSSSSVMNGTRYNELSKIANDPAKLSAANATPEEISFLKKVNEVRDAKMDSVNAAYQKIAKEYVTGAVFNKVKKALTTDAGLKKRYDSLMVELAKDNPGGAAGQQ